jgi:hypothetical protein
MEKGILSLPLLPNPFLNFEKKERVSTYYLFSWCILFRKIAQNLLILKRYGSN